MTLDFNLDNFYENLVDKDSITIEIQLEAWRNILGLHIQLDEFFCNPRRTTKPDNHPGCKLNQVGNVVLMSDYGDDYWNRKSIFHIVQDQYGVDYKKCLQIIYYDLASDSARQRASLHTSTTYKVTPKFKFQIYVKNRKWVKFDRQYYGYAEITREQLEFENCYPINTYWTNSKSKPKEFIGRKCNKSDPGYSYIIDGNIKMRFPKRDKKLKNPISGSKWISNITKYQIGGKRQIINNPGELRHIIITKALRDYLAISNAGYNCRFLPNESVYLSKEFISWLDNNFDIIIFIMDNDARGIATSKRIKSQWKNQIQDKPIYSTVIPVEYLLDEITDPFDICKSPKYGFKILQEELSIIYEKAEKNLYNYEKDI